MRQKKIYNVKTNIVSTANKYPIQTHRRLFRSNIEKNFLLITDSTNLNQDTLSKNQVETTITSSNIESVKKK